MRGNSRPTRPQKGHLFGRYLSEINMFDGMKGQELSYSMLRYSSLEGAAALADRYQIAAQSSEGLLRSGNGERTASQYVCGERRRKRMKTSPRCEEVQREGSLQVKAKKWHSV